MVVKHWTPSGSRKGPVKQGLSNLPSFCLSYSLSFHSFVNLSVCLGVFLEWYYQFYLNFGMVLETHMKFCMTESDFLGGKMCPKNCENGPNMLDLFYHENLYYFMCSCTNPIFWKIFVPEIWAKMFLVNQIAGFFNQPYLLNGSMEQPDVLHVNTNSHKLKLDQNEPWHGQK